MADPNQSHIKGVSSKKTINFENMVTQLTDRSVHTKRK